MIKIQHKVLAFKHLHKYDGNRWISKVEPVSVTVYKICIDNHVRLICAFKSKSRWIPMDVLSGITLQGHFTTKATALQELEEFFTDFLDPKYPHIRINRIENLNKQEKELYKALDEDQKVCYNNLVDLCVN